MDTLAEEGTASASTVVTQPPHDVAPAATGAGAEIASVEGSAEYHQQTSKEESVSPSQSTLDAEPEQTQYSRDPSMGLLQPSWPSRGKPEGSIQTSGPPPTEPFPEENPSAGTSEPKKVVINAPLQKDVKNFLKRRLGKLINCQRSCPDVSKPNKNSKAIQSAR